MREDYKEYAKRHAPKSPLLLDTVKAFVAGGVVCTIGEAFKNIYIFAGINGDDASLLASCTLIFAAVLLTGLGVFDNVARHAGAGVLVPITGFANAVAAPAIDSKSEGYVLGVGAKIFTVAGPVLLYGTASGMVYGAIYSIYKLAAR